MNIYNLIALVSLSIIFAIILNILIPVRGNEEVMIIVNLVVGLFLGTRFNLFKQQSDNMKT